eukprot:755883-Hanusia_phi.AAC.5
MAALALVIQLSNQGSGPTPPPSLAQTLLPCFLFGIVDEKFYCAMILVSTAHFSMCSQYLKSSSCFCAMIACKRFLPLWEREQAELEQAIVKENTG